MICYFAIVGLNVSTTNIYDPEMAKKLHFDFYHEFWHHVLDHGEKHIPKISDRFVKCRMSYHDLSILLIIKQSYYSTQALIAPEMNFRFGISS